MKGQLLNGTRHFSWVEARAKIKADRGLDVPLAMVTDQGLGSTHSPLL